MLEFDKCAKRNKTFTRSSRIRLVLAFWRLRVEFTTVASSSSEAVKYRENDAPTYRIHFHARIRRSRIKKSTRSTPMIELYRCKSQA